MQKPPYKPEACFICNLKRSAIADSKSERSLNQQTELAALFPTSDRAIFNSI